MAKRGCQGAGNTDATFRFMDLPAELRLTVYDYMMATHIDHVTQNQKTRWPSFMQTCRRTLKEALPTYINQTRAAMSQLRIEAEELSAKHSREYEIMIVRCYNSAGTASTLDLYACIVAQQDETERLTTQSRVLHDTLSLESTFLRLAAGTGKVVAK